MKFNEQDLEINWEIPRTLEEISNAHDSFSEFIWRMENGGILQDDNSIYQIDDEELSIVKAMRSALCWSLKHKNPTMSEILEIIEEELEVIEKGKSSEGKQCYFDDEEE